MTMFHLERALRLYAKAVLLRLGYDYPCIYSLRKLLEIIGDLTESIEIKKLLEEYSVEFERWRTLM